jgi:hypothetical protein
MAEQGKQNPINIVNHQNKDRNFFNKCNRKYSSFTLFVFGPLFFSVLNSEAKREKSISPFS